MPPTFQSAVALAKQKQLRAADAEFKELAFSSSRIFGFDAAVASVRGALAQAEALHAQACALDEDKPLSRRRLLDNARSLVEDDAAINALHAQCAAKLSLAQQHCEKAVGEFNAGHLKAANEEAMAAHALDSETPEIVQAHRSICAQYQQRRQDTRHLRIFGYSGAVLAAVLALGIGGFFLLRDTWEADHGKELVEITDAASTARAQHHEFEALDAANKAIALVGERKLENDILRGKLEEAKGHRAEAEAAIKGVRARVDAVKGEHVPGRVAEACTELRVRLKAMGPGGDSMLAELSQTEAIARNNALAELGKRAREDWAKIEEKLPGKKTSVPGGNFSFPESAPPDWDAADMRAKAGEFLASLPLRSVAMGGRPVVLTAQEVDRYANLARGAINQANAKIRKDHQARLDKAANQADLNFRLERMDEAIAAAAQVNKELIEIPDADLDPEFRKRVARKMDFILQGAKSEAEGKKALETYRAAFAKIEEASAGGQWDEVVKLAQAAEELVGKLERKTYEVRSMEQKVERMVQTARAKKAAAGKSAEDGKKRADTRLFSDFALQAMAVSDKYRWRRISKQEHAKLRREIQVTFNQIEAKKLPNDAVKDLYKQAEEALQKVAKVDLQREKEFGNATTSKYAQEAHEALEAFVEAYYAYRSEKQPQRWRPSRFDDN